MNFQIINAIREKKLIIFNYNDRKRIVEPYRYGQSKNKNELLRAYEVYREKFASDKPKPINKKETCWKIFKVSDIKDLKVLDYSFEIRKSYVGYSDKAISLTFEKVNTEYNYNYLQGM